MYNFETERAYTPRCWQSCSSSKAFISFLPVCASWLLHVVRLAEITRPQNILVHSLLLHLLALSQPLSHTHTIALSASSRSRPFLGQGHAWWGGHNSHCFHQIIHTAQPYRPSVINVWCACHFNGSFYWVKKLMVFDSFLYCRLVSKLQTNPYFVYFPDCLNELFKILIYS